MPMNGLIIKRQTVRMDDPHKEHEAKAEHDEGRGSAPPGHVNEPLVTPQAKDDGQELVSNKFHHRAAVD
jgi:hypothetical protein